MKLRLLLSIWPLLLLWLDLMYGFLLNINTSLLVAQTAAPARDLPVSPTIAFSWLQVVTNGMMVLSLSYSLAILVRLNQMVLRHEFWPLTLGRWLALMLILAFSLPSCWQWCLAITDMLNGQAVIAWHNKRYLITALLMPYPAILCLWLLWRKRWHQPPVAAAVITSASLDQTIN